MDNGKIVEEVAPDALLYRPAHAKTKAYVAAFRSMMRDNEFGAPAAVRPVTLPQRSHGLNACG